MTTIADRITKLLAMHERLNAESNSIIDQYVEEVAAPRCPGVPKGVVRALEIDQRVGGMLNYPEALRFLRQQKA